ncbi:MAG: ISNCY family transposase [Pseudomonadales bacterium]|nr:ISNCY family transposase [Pseudomonadales bacterium]
MTETVTLSHRELDRAKVLGEVLEGRLRQVDAARQLGLTPRQVRRLLSRLAEEGPAGLASRKRGRPSSRRLSAEVRQQALALARDPYDGFNVTHLHEMLTERHGLILSRETLRKLLIEAGRHRPDRRRTGRRHPGRPRRPCRGELVQIDGSDHAWFGDDHPRCTLLVFIDDATSELLALRFVPAETTLAYLHVLRDYLAEHGRPVALYSDRHTVFRNNLPGYEGDLTQFGRALKTLDIEGIQAWTPQAKGRVERANQTLQDRLINEMRLAGIQDPDAGNHFLEEYRARYNARFGRVPAHPEDAHRPVLHAPEELELILALHSERTVSKDLMIRYANARYELLVEGRTRRFQGRKITVCETPEGEIRMCHEGRRVPFRLLEAGAAPMALADEKSIHQQVENALTRQRAQGPVKPSPDHPWRRAFSSRAAVS